LHYAPPKCAPKEQQATGFLTADFADFRRLFLGKREGNGRKKGKIQEGDGKVIKGKEGEGKGKARKRTIFYTEITESYRDYYRS
jgi:hypothetical protein